MILKLNQWFKVENYLLFIIFIYNHIDYSPNSNFYFKRKIQKQEIDKGKGEQGSELNVVSKYTNKNPKASREDITCVMPLVWVLVQK